MSQLADVLAELNEGEVSKPVREKIDAKGRSGCPTGGPETESKNNYRWCPNYP